MRILVAGVGVIDTAYGAHLAAAGHTVSVPVVADVGADTFDLILVAVRGEQLKAACLMLTHLAGTPTVLVFANDPTARPPSQPACPAPSGRGFPAMAGY